MENKNEFTIEHAKRIYQTIADIVGPKYNYEITAKDVKKKENN